MENQVFESSMERIFQFQDSLPPLPVASLEGTLSKYLDAGMHFREYGQVVLSQLAYILAALIMRCVRALHFFYTLSLQYE